MTKVKIGIIGATGLAGEGVLDILLNHPNVEISCLTSDRLGGKAISQALPKFKNKIDLILSETIIDELVKKCDIVFMTKKDPESMKLVQPMLDAGLRVIDLGGEFRLKDATEYEKWYKHEHLAKGLLEQAVYGMPEWNRAQIKTAKLIANPGCYPTGNILSIAPLVKEGLIDNTTISIVSYSGISGAGRSFSPAAKNLYVECNENIRAYSITSHKHTPEIEQGISIFGGKKTTVSFTPHLAPMDRGIFSTVSAKAIGEVTAQNLIEALNKYYKNEKFVRVFENPADVQVQQISHTNYCDLSATIDERTNTVLIFSAVDNLSKGAASQAVQNMNIMCNFEEDLAIRGKV